MGGIEQREGEPLEEFEKRLRQEIAESKKKVGRITREGKVAASKAWKNLRLRLWMDLKRCDS